MWESQGRSGRKVKNLHKKWKNLKGKKWPNWKAVTTANIQHYQQLSKAEERCENITRKIKNDNRRGDLTRLFSAKSATQEVSKRTSFT